MDDCVQEAMVKSMQVPSITAVEPIVTEKLTKTEKKLKEVTGQWDTGHFDPVTNLT